jgi:hypothetical protein
MEFPTVESCIEDFFSYIPTEKMFLSEDMGKEQLKRQLDSYWNEVISHVPELDKDENGKLMNGKEILKGFRDRISSGIKYFKESDKLPMFKDYSFDQFKSYIDNMVDVLFMMQTDDDDEFSIEFMTVEGFYPKDILDQIKEEFIEGFYYYATYGWDEGATHLIFSGFGKSYQIGSIQVQLPQQHLQRLLLSGLGGQYPLPDPGRIGMFRFHGYTSYMLTISRKE